MGPGAPNARKKVQLIRVNAGLPDWSKYIDLIAGLFTLRINDVTVIMVLRITERAPRIRRLGDYPAVQMTT